MITVAHIDFKAGQRLPLHKHSEGQILFARSGTVEVTTEGKVYLLPPSRLAWIPPERQHELKFRTPTQLRTAYVPETILGQELPDTRIMQTTELFRALLLRIVEAKKLEATFRENLEKLLIAELPTLPSEQFHLTLPSDERAKRVALALLETPSDTRNLEDWASIAACSAKTLSRLFTNETGQTFKLWRRHVKLLSALDHLETGKSVTETAHAVGFSTSSAFTEAFRLTFGYPPTKR